MKISYSLRRILAAVWIGAALVNCACSGGSSRSDELTARMRSNYDTTAKLYHYVWSPGEFTLSSNHAAIVSLLDKQIENFEQLHLNDSPHAVATAKAQLAMLTDIRRRFSEGSKDYANWRLRGLTGACIACHANAKARSDFIGGEIHASDSSFYARMAAAEFLVASRQYDKARDELYRLAKSLSHSHQSHNEMMAALKLWLFVEVESKGRLEEPLRALDKFRSGVGLDLEHKTILDHWAADLEKLAEEDADSDDIASAENLMKEVAGQQMIYEDELGLVKSLRAAAILNNVLREEDTDSDAHRRAEFLLAVAYNHIPIASLEVYQELYLEQCIRHHPGSGEAQRAFQMLESRVLEQSSGSSGLHLDDDDRERLEELKSLAF